MFVVLRSGVGSINGLINGCSGGREGEREKSFWVMGLYYDAIWCLIFNSKAVCFSTVHSSYLRALDWILKAQRQALFFLLPLLSAPLLFRGTNSSCLWPGVYVSVCYLCESHHQSSSPVLPCLFKLSSVFARSCMSSKETATSATTSKPNLFASHLNTPTHKHKQVTRKHAAACWSGTLTSWGTILSI